MSSRGALQTDPSGYVVYKAQQAWSKDSKELPRAQLSMYNQYCSMYDSIQKGKNLSGDFPWVWCSATRTLIEKKQAQSGAVYKSVLNQRK